MDSASSASRSSSVVFPGAPDSMVLSERSLPSSSSSVDGAGVLGVGGGCPSMGPTCPAVFTSSSKMSVTYTPRNIPNTPPTRIGRLEDLNTAEDMPNEADRQLWTHGDDEEDEATVRALIETAEDPEEAFKQRLHCGSAYVEEIIDD